MNELHKYYGTAEGPLGFPMTDKQAVVLEEIIGSIPRDTAHAYRKLAKPNATTELAPGERSDVSWITTEDVDRVREVVVANGMNDSQYALNPIVTLNHAYWQPPVGRCLWRKRVKDGDRVGVKAKTQYPSAPADWPQGKDWPPDLAFGYVQSRLLNGKSIGFLPLKVHEPTAGERERNGWGSVELVIDEWLLLEYAACWVPCNQNTVVEDVSKALPADFRKALGVESLSAETISAVMPHTPLDEIEKAIRRHLDNYPWEALVQRAVDDVLKKRQGRV